MAKLRVDKIAAPIVKDEFTGSVFFDGNGDHLDVPLSDDFQFGAGDFSIEAWVYLVEAKDQAIFGTNNSASPNYEGYELDVFTNGSVRFYSGNGSAYNYGALGLESSAGVVPQQTWTHLVISRQGNTLRLFVNGVLSVSNNSFSHTIEDSAVAPDIGNDGRSTGTSYHTHGYISNLRVCKGHAVYTGNFTVPTRELEVHTKPPKGVVFPAADNVTVLLACQSATDATLDSSGRHTITAAGNATAADANPGLLSNTNITSTITENTGSVAFDGNGDYLSVGDPGNDFDLAGDFTVEFWVYFNSTGMYQDIIGTATNSVYLGSGKGGWVAAYYVSMGASKWHFSYQTNSSWTFENHYSFSASTNTWYHVAFTREGSDLKCYVDGVQRGSAISTSTNLISTEKRLSIGAGHGANAGYLNGHVSNVRVCKGHAVYTSNFVPPTRELEVHQGPDDDRTVLLACYDGENVFAEKTGKIVAAYGDRQSTPTQSLNNSPIGITTVTPGLTRNVDPTAGPTFQGGAGFTSQNWLTLPKGTTTERFVEVANNAVSASSARGIFQGGVGSPANVNTIEYVTIGSLGDGTDFGDMTIARQYRTSVSSSTRGVTAGGDPTTDVIDYITISTLGNAQDFGNLFTGRYGTGGCSSSIRGVWAGGFPGFLNTMDYVTIASTGDAKDFGDLTTGRGYLTGCGSPSRGLFAGGLTPTKVNTIDFITIASMGNAFDFGDLTSTRAALAGCSNSIRGLFAGGNTPTMVNTIDYVAIPTTGNAVDFGDLSILRENKAACSSSTRGVWGGGNDPSNTKRNTIDYVELATLGDAIDIGDLTPSRKGVAGCSNGHGGLG